jgi:hypothetical protein
VRKFLSDDIVLLDEAADIYVQIISVYYVPGFIKSSRYSLIEPRPQQILGSKPVLWED